MKPIVTVISIVAGAFTATAQVTLTADFSNPANQRAPIHNFWSVRNQIPNYPSVGPQQPPQANSVNCVRLLGGWSNSAGTMLESEDVCYWDGNGYAYRWNKLTSRIDAVRAQGKQIHQVVLDNVPWCFQRGYVWGVDYPLERQVTTYGNSLPPSDPVAWSDFIKATMNKLIETYGLEEVRRWRFRIGTESDYVPHHWAGSKMDFFNHYRNTANAVLSVLPDAKLAAHFLGAGGNGRYGAEFVRWCHANNVKYDFIGISIYPFYTNSNHVDLDRMYQNDFLPFVNQPEWNPDARLEIPEYSLFTEKDDDGFNMGVGTSHNPAFVTMLAKTVYERSIGQIHSWGDKTKDPVFVALGTMVGMDRFNGQKSGAPTTANNKIDGIFAADAPRTAIDAMLYSYNANPAYVADETVNLSFTIPQPAGTRYEYRIATYDRDTNPQQLFQKKYPQATLRVSEGGWIADRVMPTSPNLTDVNGFIDQIIEEPGKTIWNNEKSNYAKYGNLQWSGWTDLATTGAGVGTSKLNLTVPLSSFSFQKFEFRLIKLSHPWQRSDIGSPAAPGDASDPEGLFTITGSGNDIWNTADNFHYIYQPASGDGEIVARVLSVGDTHPWAKVGVMIRESLDADSKHASTLVTPGNGVTFQQRTATGGTSVNVRAIGITAPHWVKLKRAGDTFTASRSSDGANWTEFTSGTVSMGPNVYLGLAVCSHNDGVTTTATFDNVAVSIPVAHAGTDQTVVDFNADGSEFVTLDGTASTPGIGSISSYEWKQGSTTIASGASPKLSLPLGVHEISLTVANQTGATSSDMISVTVLPFAAPSEDVLHGDPADASPIQNVNGTTLSMGSTANDPEVYAGQFNNNARSPVFVFQLPDLGAVASPFASASLAFHLRGMETVPGNVDLYGLDARSSPTVLTSDFWGETPTPDSTDAEFLQDNLLVPSSATGVIHTSTDIASYLNTQYAGGSNIGKYVFLRLSTDADFGNSQRYFITTANGAATHDAGSPDHTVWPRIHFTAVSPYPDTDDDGMPDQWEMQNFKSLAKTATADDDGDGQSNAAEYIAGTDPTDPASRFSVKSLTPANGGGFTMRWDSRKARTYTVFKSDGLTSASWVAITPPQPGTGAEMLHTVPANETTTSEFYRIHVNLHLPN